MGELDRRLASVLGSPAAAAVVPVENGESLEDAAPLVLPGEVEEAAFLAEAGARGEQPVAVETEAPLPPLDQLVQRIPAGVRTVLDELFRARFTGVKRALERELRTVQTSK